MLLSTNLSSIPSSTNLDPSQQVNVAPVLIALIKVFFMIVDGLEFETESIAL